MTRWTILMVAILVAMMLGGCATWNQTAVSPDGKVNLTTNPANVATMDNDGHQIAVSHGLAPSNLKQDADGNWVTQGGPLGILSYNLNGQMYLVTPQDCTLTGVEFTPQPAPGKPAFKAASISLNISEPLKQYVSAFNAAAAAIQGMTQTEATARIEEWRVAKQISDTVAQALMATVVPLLPK